MSVAAGDAVATTTTKVNTSVPGVPCPGPAGIVYKGARYLTKFADPIEWNNETTYEYLTVVQHEGDSYVSKQNVPVGVDISDTEYWLHWADYNAQIEQYRKEVKELADKVTLLQSRGVRVSELGYKPGDNIDDVFTEYNGNTPYIDLDVIGAVITKPITLNRHTLLTSSNIYASFQPELCNLVWRGATECAVISVYEGGNGLDAQNQGTVPHLAVENVFIDANGAKVGYCLVGATETSRIGNIGVYNAQVGVLLGHNWINEFGTIYTNKCTGTGVFGDTDGTYIKNLQGTYNINNTYIKAIHSNYAPVAIDIQNHGTGNTLGTVEVEHYTDTGFRLKNGQWSVASVYTETGSVVEGTQNYKYDLDILASADSGHSIVIGCANAWKTNIGGMVVIGNLSKDPDRYRPLMEKNSQVADMELGGPITLTSNFTVGDDQSKLSAYVYANAANIQRFYVDKTQFNTYFPLKKKQLYGVQIYCITAPSSEETFQVFSETVTSSPGKTGFIYEKLSASSSDILGSVSKQPGTGYYLVNIWTNAIPYFNLNSSDA